MYYVFLVKCLLLCKQYKQYINRNLLNFNEKLKFVTFVVDSNILKCYIEC